MPTKNFIRRYKPKEVYSFERREKKRNHTLSLLSLFHKLRLRSKEENQCVKVDERWS